MSFFKGFNLSAILLLQFLERFSYFNVLIQLPIYISQKGIENALGLGQEVKGWIFFTWALVQNVTPIFTGIIADRISQEKTIFLSIILISLGYLSFSLSQSIPILLTSVILVGIGSGGFKPSLQGLLSQSPKKNVWSVYLIINNLAFLFALVFSNYIKQYGWNIVFLGSFITSILNLLLSYSLLKIPNREKIYSSQKIENSKVNITEIAKLITQKRMLFILCFTTCFAIIYMQFYETLPNYIVDWIDTSNIAQFLGLSKEFTMLTSYGRGISYEFIYILNPVIVIAFAQIFQKVFSTKDSLYSIFVSQAFVTIGLAFCSFSINGLHLILGMIIYTFGEILFNIKILELVSKIAPSNRKSTYLGSLSISYTLGLTLGAVSAGYLYKGLAEKYSLAMKYLEIHKNTEISHQGVDNFFISKESTLLLWHYFKPYVFWTPFIFIGLVGIFTVYMFKKYNDKIIVNKQGKK